MSDRHTAGAREALELLGAERIVTDKAGPAVYRLAPEPAMTAVACLSCRYVALVPSIPRVPELAWECSRCKWRTRLEPPAEVWLLGSRVAVIPPLS